MWFQYIIYPIGFCAAFMVFVLIHQYIKSGWLVDIVCKFGGSTLGVYLIHPFIIDIINEVFGQMNSIMIFAVSLIVSVLSYFIVLLLRQSKLTKRLLLGEYK